MQELSGRLRVLNGTPGVISLGSERGLFLSTRAVTPCFLEDSLALTALESLACVPDVAASADLDDARHGRDRSA